MRLNAGRGYVTPVLDGASAGCCHVSWKLMATGACGQSMVRLRARLARVTCREEHLKDPGRHLNLSIAERVFPAGRVCAFVFACES